MKTKIRPIMIVLFVIVFCLVGCASSDNKTENKSEIETASIQKSTNPPTQTVIQTDNEKENNAMIKITVGNNTINAKLENNETVTELISILENGPVTMSAENYGGFEKVCDLGQSLSSNDEQMTAKSGDIMLYNSKNIVIFYGENSWAYTKLGTVIDEDLDKLSDILSGNESKITIELLK